jgi:hypothetical protein
MAIKFSTALATKLSGIQSLRDSIAGYVIDVYSGSQPATPDTAAAGSLLVTVTASSGAFTAETAAVGSMTLTGGGSGSVNTVTVNAIDILGGAVSYITDLNTTATAVATQINRNPKNQLFVASTTGASAVITLTAINGLGTLANGWAVTATLTTITASYVNIGTGTAGVNSANGLNWDVPSSGVISKIATDTWSGTAALGGTAGWFRIRGAGDTGAGASTTAIRIDGTIGTSGADMNLGSLTITGGAPFILSSATLTVPTA